MAGGEYGLGRFGDLRLEKGGRACMRRWLPALGRTSVGSAGRELGRCSLRAFCATAP